MNVFTSGFATTENATSTPLTHPRIGYHNLLRTLALDLNSIAVSSEASGAPRDAPLRPDTVEYWEPTAVNATWKVDLGSAQNIDYIGIAGHNLGSVGATLLAEVSTDDATYATFAESETPTDDSPIMFLDTSVSRRYVRLTMSVAIARIAVIYLGQVLKPSRPMYGGVSPPKLSRVTELQTSVGRNGNFLGQAIRKKGISTSFQLQNLTAAWYRTNFDPFVQAARQYPYFIGWRPNTFPEDCVYGWSTQRIKPQNAGKRDLMSVSWDLVGEGYE